MLDVGQLIFEDGLHLFLCSISGLLPNNTGGRLGDNLHDSSLHNLRDFPAHYFIHLLAHRSLDFFADGMCKFMFLHNILHCL
jgi:hypothetical protein